MFKLLFKEVIQPEQRAASRCSSLAPLIALAPAFAAWAVVPFDAQVVLSNTNAGLLYLLAMTSLGVYGIILAGWASNSKYAFLGAMRSAAQVVVYEIAMGFALVGVLILRRQPEPVRHRRWRRPAAWASWNWFWLPLLPMFVIYFVSGVAETNRAPFDVAEGESEIVAGFHVEYSGSPFAVFFLAEYANMILVSFLAAILFLGGWLSPFHGRGHPVPVGRAAGGGCSPRCSSSPASSSGSAQRFRATATTRSCGWAGRCSFRSRSSWLVRRRLLAYFGVVDGGRRMSMGKISQLSSRACCCSNCSAACG